MESIKAIRILALEQTLCIFGIDKKEWIEERNG
jgi:hypothetical protein